jgi:hypothetical protein
LTYSKPNGIIRPSDRNSSKEVFVIPHDSRGNLYLNRATPVILSLALSFSLSAFAGEWPRFRGPNADGISTEDLFQGPGPHQLSVEWKSAAGSGYSGIAVAGGQVVTMFAAGS